MLRATRLDQDTCLTIVSSPKQADAILEVGIASALCRRRLRRRRLGRFWFAAQGSDAGQCPQQFKKSVSATCSDGKGGTIDCKSYTSQGGDAPEQPASDWTQGISPNYTVSLASSEDSTQDLWDPNGREKHASWSDQLREAAGCPVCPGARFQSQTRQDELSTVDAGEMPECLDYGSRIKVARIPTTIDGRGRSRRFLRPSVRGTRKYSLHFSAQKTCAPFAR